MQEENSECLKEIRKTYNLLKNKSVSYQCEAIESKNCFKLNKRYLNIIILSSFEYTNCL